MAFNPDNPDNLTVEQKLYNVKVKVNQIVRLVDDISHDSVTPIEVVRFAHLVKAAMAEIQKEIDRTA
jgi:hypothetical protein